MIVKTKVIAWVITSYKSHKDLRTTRFIHCHPLSPSSDLGLTDVEIESDEEIIAVVPAQNDSVVYHEDEQQHWHQLGYDFGDGFVNMDWEKEAKYKEDEIKNKGGEGSGRGT
jgi:hypothetical protein